MTATVGLRVNEMSTEQKQQALAQKDFTHDG